MLHIGYVKTYMGCPVLWCSKLRAEIDLSTTEAERLALIQAMREVIPLMALMKEECLIFDVHLPNSEVFCKVFMIKYAYNTYDGRTQKDTVGRYIV